MPIASLPSDYSTFRIPEPRQRKAASLELTLQTADEFFNQGIQLIDQRSFSEAAEAFFSSTQLQWIFTAAHIELGNAYTARRQYDKALEAYTNALENDPRFTHRSLQHRSDLQRPETTQ